MDGATIQAKVYYGYAQAAARVGLAHNLFRPSTNPGAAPLDASNLVGQIDAGMTVATAANFNPARPAIETDFKFACLADGRRLQVGDLLQRLPANAPTYFVGAMDPLMPIVALRCNTIVSVKRRMSTDLPPGLAPYQGPVEILENAIVAAMPAVINMASAGRNTRSTGLPGDSPGPIKYEVFLPPTVSQSAIQNGDLVYDDLGRRLIVAGLEKTPLGLTLDTVHEMA